MEIGCVLIQKPEVSGLTKKDIKFLLDKLPDNAEVYPMEICAREQECVAMGFITWEAANRIDYEYEERYAWRRPVFPEFIESILDDVNNENENCLYDFQDKFTVWFGYSPD